LSALKSTPQSFSGEANRLDITMDSIRETPILAGTHIVIRGLSSRQELNGCAGIVVAYDRAADRYVIRLDGAVVDDEAYFRVRERCLTKKSRVLNETGAEAMAQLMVAKGLLPEETIFTNSCKSSRAGVVNQSHLIGEVTSAVVANGGRISLTSLHANLGAELSDEIVEEMVNSGDYRVLSATDDLVTIGWAKSLASKVVAEAQERGAISCNQRAVEAGIPAEYLESIILEGIASGQLEGVRLDASHRCIVSLSFDQAVVNALSQACHAATQPLVLASSIIAVQPGRPPTVGARTSSSATEKSEDQLLFKSLLDDDYIHAAALTLTDKVPGLIRGGGRE
jgi:hypothetical protein